MNRSQHINVTIRFEHIPDEEWDLRIPTLQTAQQLIQNVVTTLKLSNTGVTDAIIEVETKDLVLADDDYLIDYPIVDGDYLVIKNR